MSKFPIPFHDGERALQHVTGEEATARQNGVMISVALLGSARVFLIAQRMLVLGSGDPAGRLWGSVVFGEHGWVTVDDSGGLVSLDLTRACLGVRDVLRANLHDRARLGLLAIDLATRRRLRVNGRVESISPERLALRIEETFPNCPKYIQRRRLRVEDSNESEKQRCADGESFVEGDALSNELASAIAAADTFFVVSGHAERGLDVSHRGGNPGFVQIVAPGVLRVPDYRGNSLFNTLGNLLIDPHCGLTTIDFSRGRVYQMTGEAELHVDHTVETEDATTGRYWDFRLKHWRAFDLLIRAAWDYIDASQYNPA